MTTQTSERSTNTNTTPEKPRNNIKFEYSISRGEKEIMRTLRNMIDFLKGKTEK